MEIIHQEDPQEAANLCLDMVIRGEARFVVKGNILTTYLYRALINATKILAPDQIPCTLCFHQVQGINKIFVIHFLLLTLMVLAIMLATMPWKASNQILPGR